MRTIHLIIIHAGLFFFTVPAIAQKQSAIRERLSLDEGWLFHLGDIPFPVIRGHDSSYFTSKAGRATGAAATDFDDRDWRAIDLPHDWAVESPFDSTENLSQGYRKRGYGWYRRAFKLNSCDKGKNIEIQLDGIATNSTVWVNGTVVNHNWCGYTSSYIDITQLARYGDDLNIIAVRVDAKVHQGWWYEGAGIYRHTWLVKRSPVHVTTNGVYANPVRNKKGVWTIPAEITLENSGKLSANTEVEVILFDKEGNRVCSSKTNATVKPLAHTVTAIKLTVKQPVLWNLSRPELYQLKTLIWQNGKLLDDVGISCGFRTIEFRADSGFFLNGRHVKLQGVCNHQDHAGVGVAVPDALWDFRLRKLKEMGVNAYRCAHNPPSAEFLDACDRLGILVMDENRNFNTSPEYIEQLQWMVRRDRNHPAVILWSVFNEEPMQDTENGYEMVRLMNARVKELDTTRPVTAAQSYGQFEPINVSQAVDVVGFNYQLGSYDRFHKEYPDVKLTSSEDVSGLMVRGEYTTDPSKNLVDAYDTQKPGWGSTHREAWKVIDQRPFIAGCFVWTGFDYRGEPTPYKWPSAGSFFGTMDLCGFPKTAFWIHQAQWRKDLNVLQLVPHWNWPQNMIGKKIKVMALSNADSVTVWLNGKLIEGQKADIYEMNTWEVTYQPGELLAIGYKQGKEVSRFRTETTGEPVSLQLVPDRKSLANDGCDAMPVTVQARDAKGRLVPTTDIEVQFEINNSAKIIGLGNGDPNSHEPEKGNRRSLFNGLAQVIIQSNKGYDAPIKLIARAKGLSSAELTIALDKVPAIPFVAEALPVIQLDQWRASAISYSRPDPNQNLADNDMNSWTSFRPGQLQEFKGGRYVVYRTLLKPYLAQQQKGGTILFKNLTGKAEIWLAGKMIAEKRDPKKADFTVMFSPVTNNTLLSVLIESEPNQKAGFGGTINIKAN